MARLPQPGGDAGNWGSILNDYLAQSHKSDGTIKDNSIGAAQLQDNSVTASSLAPSSVTNAAIANDAVTKTQLAPTLRTELDAKITDSAASATFAPIAVQTEVEGRLSEEELLSRFAPQSLGISRAVRSGPLTVFLGDSIFQNLNTLTNPAQPLLGESFATLVSLRSNQRVLYGRNAGVTNNTVQDAVARLQTDVIAYAPDKCVILLGTNNTNQASPTMADTMLAYENGLIRPLLEAGIDPIICTIPPRTGIRTSEPATYRKQSTWNAFLHGLANKYRLLLVDTYAALADPATGDYKAGFSGDNIHPTKTGYYAMSSAFIAAVSSRYPADGVQLEKDRYTSINLAVNPLFLEGMGGTGNLLPTGYQGSTTGVTVTVEDPTVGDGLEAGKWLKIVKTDPATQKTVSWLRSLAALTTAGNPFSVGDRISWGFRYKLTAGTDATTYVTVALRYTDSGGANVKIITPVNQFQYASEGVVYYESVIPEGCVGLRLDLSFAPASLQTIMVGQMTARNLTGLGLPALTRP